MYTLARQVSILKCKNPSFLPLSYWINSSHWNKYWGFLLIPVRDEWPLQCIYHSQWLYQHPELLSWIQNKTSFDVIDFHHHPQSSPAAMQRPATPDKVSNSLCLHKHNPDKGDTKATWKSIKPQICFLALSVVYLQLSGSKVRHKLWSENKPLLWDKPLAQHTGWRQVWRRQEEKKKITFYHLFLAHNTAWFNPLSSCNYFSSNLAVVQRAHTHSDTPLISIVGIWEWTSARKCLLPVFTI